MLSKRPQVQPKTLSKRRPGGSKLAVIALVAVAVALVPIGVLLLRITVTLGAPTPCGPLCWDIVVTSVSASEPLGSYTVGLNVDGTGSPVSAPLAPGSVFACLTFTDVGAPNRLDTGDAFRLENPGDPGTTCTLRLSSFRASASLRWTC